MTTSETTVTGEPLERWTISVPKPGGPSRDPIQGTPAFTFHLSPGASDVLEDGLRRVNKSTLRRGIPLLYRGEREVCPERPEGEEERQLLAHTSAQDPGEAAAAFEVAGLKALRHQLLVDIEARRKELEALNTKIAAAGSRYEAETERQDRLLAAQMKHNQALVAQAREHYERQLRNSWETESGLEAHSTENMNRLGQQVALVTEAKRQMNSMMKASTAADLFSGIKDNVSALLNSPIGQQIGTNISASVTAMVNERLAGKRPAGAKPIEREDVIVAFALQGQAFRDRQTILLELKLRPEVNSARAEAALLGAQFASGGVEVRTLVEFISRE
jgi:hypothetical protein